jgi:hypothetical protein
MGKGLLAWWRRRIVARGLAGAALFAVPVAVAALIGFGSGFAGVAGGLSSVTNGPDAVPTAAQTGPNRLNRAVVALASRQTGSNGSNATVRGGDRDSGSIDGSSGTGTTSENSGTTESGNGSSGTQAPPVTTPNAPSVSLPGTGGGGGSSSAVGGANDVVNGTVNQVLGGVNNTLNGLLGH